VQPVFADTFYWVALLHRKDARHKAVLEFSRDFASTFVTTDEVLTEVLAFSGSDCETCVSFSKIVAFCTFRIQLEAPSHCAGSMPDIRRLPRMFYVV
jgi:predicted nucleic acid-binding protein